MNASEGTQDESGALRLLSRAGGCTRRAIDDAVQVSFPQHISLRPRGFPSGTRLQSVGDKRVIGFGNAIQPSGKRA